MVHLRVQLLGQIPGWKMYPESLSIASTSTILGNSPFSNAVTKQTYNLGRGAFHSAPRPQRKVVPHGPKHPLVDYLGIKELRVNLLVGLAKKLALFSEFKDCICKRRTNSLKRATSASAVSVLTINSPKTSHISLQIQELE